MSDRQESNRTVLPGVQAEGGALQHGGVLADVPDVEEHEDGERCEGGDAEPGQHEDVRQQDELQPHRDTCHIDTLGPDWSQPQGGRYHSVTGLLPLQQLQTNGMQSNDKTTNTDGIVDGRIKS